MNQVSRVFYIKKEEDILGVGDMLVTIPKINNFSLLFALISLFKYYELFKPE